MTTDLVDEDATTPAPTIPCVIRGESHQYLAFDLAPGDRVVVEHGAFLSASGPVRVSAAVVLSGARSWIGIAFGPLRWLNALIRKRAGGERAWSQVIEATGSAEVLAANPLGGQIIRVPLDDAAVTMRRGSWIAQSGDIALGVAMVPALLRAVFARATWVWQSANGIGDVFIGAHGNVTAYALEEGESIFVDPTSVLAWQGIATWRQVSLGSIRGTLFAGEGLALLEAVGPGYVMLDTGTARARRERLLVDAADTAAAAR